LKFDPRSIVANGLHCAKKQMLSHSIYLYVAARLKEPIEKLNDFCIDFSLQIKTGAVKCY